MPTGHRTPLSPLILAVRTLDCLNVSVLSKRVELPSLKNILHHLFVGVSGCAIEFLYFARVEPPPQRTNILLGLV